MKNYRFFRLAAPFLAYAIWFVSELIMAIFEVVGINILGRFQGFETGPESLRSFFFHNIPAQIFLVFKNGVLVVCLGYLAARWNRKHPFLSSGVFGLCGVVETVILMKTRGDELAATLPGWMITLSWVSSIPFALAGGFLFYKLRERSMRMNNDQG